MRAKDNYILVDFGATLKVSFVRRTFTLLIILLTCIAISAAEPPQLAVAGNEQQSQPGGRSGMQRPPQRDPEIVIRQYDRDGDGRISLEEAPEGMRQHWDEIDTNRDGYVTIEELQSHRARMESKGPRPESAHSSSAVGKSGPPQNAALNGKARFRPAGTFSVITLGTGSPQYDPSRSGPSALIQYQGKFFLVDMGNGTQARLYDADISPGQINAILLTHHHLDHNEEFIPLFIVSRLLEGRPEIIGPPRTGKLVDFIMDFYSEDIAYRLARRDLSLEDFRKISLREIKGGESFMLGGMKVSTARVNHTIHTVAYRFDADGLAIVISGDLSYSESLIELARNADVLVIDSGGAIRRKGRHEKGGPNAADRLRLEKQGGDALKAHASFKEVATMAQKAGVKRLVLTHIGPGEVDEEATIRGLGEIYKGEAIVGRDLMEILPIVSRPASSASPVAR